MMGKGWQAFLDEVARLRTELTELGHSTIWYRGHSNVDWKCVSTLHRHVENFIAIGKLSNDEKFKVGMLKAVKSTVYLKFCVRKVVISQSLFDEVRGFLELAGASEFGYFPDLEGLKAEFQKSYEIEVQDMLRHQGRS